ncbi:MAG: very short patch repair endonuclease, partial [Rhizomicrobium sp.]
GTNVDFWKAKFEANIRRDGEVIRKLCDLGWRSLVVWECETSDQEVLTSRLKAFLDQGGNHPWI